MVPIIWNNFLVVDVAGACAIGGTAVWLATISGGLNNSGVIQSFYHDKSSSTFQ